MSPGIIHRALFLALWGLSFLVNCATIPKAGAGCDEGSAWCSNSTTALSCRDGVVTAFACPGPAGCVRDSSRHARCDQSMGAVAGGLCLADQEGHGQCSLDGSSLLQCTRGAWVQTACASGSTCHVDPGGLSCR